MLAITDRITELTVALKRWLTRHKLRALLSPRLIPGTTLVIIDMQDPYLPDSPQPSLIVDPVNALIDRARADDSSIIKVEMENDGLTVPAVSSKLTGYRRCARVEKTDADGSQEVSDECMLRGFGTEVLKVCGLWACSCVFDTVEVLAELYPHSRIEVHARACGFNPHSHLIYERLPENVVIVWDFPQPIGDSGSAAD